VFLFAQRRAGWIRPCTGMRSSRNPKSIPGPENRPCESKGLEALKSLLTSQNNVDPGEYGGKLFGWQSSDLFRQYRFIDRNNQ
jgi:hypothetical protein